MPSYTEAFQIIRPIGKGASCMVYEAVTNSKHGKMRVALKEIDATGFTASLFRELQLLLTILHSNISQLIDIIVFPTKIVIVTPYQPATLASALLSHTSGLNQRSITAYMQQIFEATAYLHLHSVLHRDLKLPNILLSDNNKVKITDFGLSRPFGLINDMFSPSITTLPYRPPEVILGCTMYGREVDIWPIGVMWLELFLGHSLFEYNPNTRLPSPFDPPSQYNASQLAFNCQRMPQAITTSLILSSLMPTLKSAQQATIWGQFSRLSYNPLCIDTPHQFMLQKEYPITLPHVLTLHKSHQEAIQQLNWICSVLGTPPLEQLLVYLTSMASLRTMAVMEYTCKQNNNNIFPNFFIFPPNSFYLLYLYQYSPMQPYQLSPRLDPNTNPFVPMIMQLISWSPSQRIDAFNYFCRSFAARSR